MPLLDNIRVFRSPVHGYGVVAKRDIQQDEVIAEVEGVLCRSGEIEDDTYCLLVDDEHFLDMVDQTRWINHSCDPNADVESDFDGEGGAWARIVACRPIRAGEEITYHYSFSPEVAEPCWCGAANCQGWIVDPDQMDELTARLAREPALVLRRKQAPTNGTLPENDAWTPVETTPAVEPTTAERTRR